MRVLESRPRGEFVEHLLEAALSGAHLGKKDRGLCQELVYGVVRWQATLDWLIGQKTKNRVQKSALQNLLRLGLYQIFWLERVPDHAAVFETVALAREFGLGPQSGFVNAVLRGYLRELEATKAKLEDLKTTNPALGYSHPAWLVGRWLARWDAAQVSRLLAWNNAPPKTFARVNTLKTDAEKLLLQWREEGVEYDFVRRDWLDENALFEFKSGPPLGSLPSFQGGMYYIQDASTLLTGQAMNPQPGERILDVCAAPGGKLTHLAQLVGNEARITARDVSAERLEMVKENCTRLGVTCVSLEFLDAAKGPVPPSGAQAYDRILIDAPCSNTGVMRRRVDLRWRIQQTEIPRLRKNQIRLLEDSAPLLKNGGTLIYSTCSLEPEENQEVIKSFTTVRPEFTLEFERELTPFTDEVDGAYVARLRKR